MSGRFTGRQNGVPTAVFQLTLFLARESPRSRFPHRATLLGGPTCVFERASPANVLMRTSLLVTVRSFPSGSACRDEAVTSRESFSAKFVALADLVTILRTVDAQG
jgi:hypothetical protein